MTHQKKQVRISDIVIPKYLPVFNDRKYRHIILTSGRAGTKSSFVAIRANYQIHSGQSWFSSGAAKASQQTAKNGV